MKIARRRPEARYAVSWADLVPFDPAAIIDTATYDTPQPEPDDIRLVVVNGAVAYQRTDPTQAGNHTGARSGKMLRYRRDPFPG